MNALFIEADVRCVADYLGIFNAYSAAFFLRPANSSGGFPRYSRARNIIEVNANEGSTCSFPASERFCCCSSDDAECPMNPLA